MFSNYLGVSALYLFVELWLTSLSSFNKGKKSAEDTLQTLKLLMDHGLRELINEPDSLGNTPLHALIVRYALEVEICMRVIFFRVGNGVFWNKIFE